MSIEHYGGIEVIVEGIPDPEPDDYHSPRVDMGICDDTVMKRRILNFLRKFEKEGEIKK